MKLGLIGCGKMGKALAVGAIDAGAVPVENVMVHDIVPSSQESFLAERDVT